MEYAFYIQDFWTTCACPETQGVPWIHYIECVFLLFRIFEQLALAPKFFAVLDMFFIILEFWVTCACSENRVALEFFTALNILFIFRIFEQLALALKDRGCLKFTVLNVYFLLFRIFKQFALALKNRVALEFSLYWNIFYYSGFLSNLRLPWKFSSPGGARPAPRPPASYAYAYFKSVHKFMFI